MINGSLEGFTAGFVIPSIFRVNWAAELKSACKKLVILMRLFVAEQVGAVLTLALSEDKEHVRTPLVI